MLVVTPYLPTLWRPTNASRPPSAQWYRTSRQTIHLKRWLAMPAPPEELSEPTRSTHCTQSFESIPSRAKKRSTSTRNSWPILSGSRMARRKCLWNSWWTMFAWATISRPEWVGKNTQWLCLMGEPLYVCFLFLPSTLTKQILTERIDTATVDYDSRIQARHLFRLAAMTEKPMSVAEWEAHIHDDKSSETSESSNSSVSSD